MTETADHKQRILERIAKLMSLAESSNPNEAAIALSRAQKLMAEHHLSQEDISFNAISEQTEKVPSILRDRVLYLTLSDIISCAFGVTPIIITQYYTGAVQGIKFIGQSDRVTAACYTFTIIARQAAIAKKLFLQNKRQEMFLMLQEVFPQPEYKKLSDYWAFDNLKRACERDLRKAVKAYLHGWLRAIREKVERFAITEEEEQLVQDYITLQLGEDTAVIKSRTVRYTKAQIDHMQQGYNDAQDQVQLFHGVSGHSHLHQLTRQ